MLLAIDVGNTHTVFGLWDGASWAAVWRCSTNARDTEDQVASTLRGLFELSGLPFRVEEAVYASVVPALNDAMRLLCSKWLGAPLRVLSSGDDVGLRVEYHPVHAVGADRLANALGAIAICEPPIAVVDFGTATTFDCIDRSGTYVGGAILPGVEISSRALAQQTANLPQIEMVAPARAIGRSTVESLQSGLMLGYVGAVDALVSQIDKELGGGATIIATGGLGERFVDLCSSISRYESTLTLDGLVIANERMAAN